MGGGRGMSTRWVVACAVLMTIAIVGVILTAHFHNELNDPPSAFAVVVDAGSTHTDFSVYTWTPTPENETAYVQLFPTFSQQKFSCGEDVGISTYASDPGQLVPLLQRCLTLSENQIPNQVRDWSSLSIRATAGMRVLAETNSSQADSIIQVLRAQVMRQPIDITQSSVAILSGTEEGAYGWVTANFVEGTLFKPQSEQYGALDLGGASTQITFRSNEAKGSDRFSAYLFHSSIELYTHSYLCFGLSAAQQRYKASVLSTLKSGNIVASPCTPFGVNITLDAAEIAEMRTNICTKQYILPNVDNAILMGTSNNIACAAFVHDLFFNGTTNLIGVGQPPLHGRFFAFGNGYSSTLEYYCERRVVPLSWCHNGPSGGWIVPPTQLRGSVDVVCNESLSVLVNNSIDTKYLDVYCFNGMYVSSLLGKDTGYGFPDSDLNVTVEAVKQVANTTVGWALGFILAQTNILFCHPGDPLLMGAGYGVCIGVSALLLLGGVAYLTWRLLQKARRRGYAPVLDSYSLS